MQIDKSLYIDKIDDLSEKWAYKKIFYATIITYTFVFIIFSFTFTGCVQKEVVTKYKYIEKPTPALQTVNINELNLSKNVRFLNFLEYNTLISLMKSSKVFVLPSTREGFGIIALEANACGLPVVTVRHRRNAVTELVKKGCGLLCELNAKDLAEKITIAIEKRKRIKRMCIERARQYDWNRIVKLIVDVYEGKCYPPDKG